MTREDLFNKAVELFGSGSTQAAHVQNPGCIPTDMELNTVILSVQEAMLVKEEEFLKLKVNMAEWLASLSKAFDSGALNT